MDLRLIESSKLRRLICKAPKYTGTYIYQLLRSAEKSTFSSTDECIDSWSREKSICQLELAEWNNLDYYKEEFKTLSHEYIKSRLPNIALKIDVVKRFLDSLRDNFNIVSINKANGNL